MHCRPTAACCPGQPTTAGTILQSPLIGGQGEKYIRKRRQALHGRTLLPARPVGPAGRGTAARSAAGAGGAGGEPLIDVTWSTKRPLPEPDPSLAPEVREALEKVSVAMQTAQSTLEHLEELPSARLPTTWDSAAAALKPLAQAGALLAACALIHSGGMLLRVLGSLAVALGMAWTGWRKSSLSASGALAALAVGAGTLGASYRGGVTLLAFFFASSLLTRLGDEEKAVDEEHKAGGQRDWKQVGCARLVNRAGGDGSARVLCCR